MKTLKNTRKVKIKKARKARRPKKVREHVAEARTSVASEGGETASVTGHVVPAFDRENADAAKTIRVMAKAKGLSQLALAKKIGVAESAVQSWCAGLSMPRVDRIPSLADALGIDASGLAQQVDLWEQQFGRGRTLAQKKAA